MLRRTLPWAIVTPARSFFSPSSFRTAKCRCLGMILVVLLPRAAFPANRRISAVTYIILAILVIMVFTSRHFAWPSYPYVSREVKPNITGFQHLSRADISSVTGTFSTFERLIAKKKATTVTRKANHIWAW